MLVLSLPAFENKKYTAYDHLHRNGPYGKIPTKKEPIRTLGFTLPYNKTAYVRAISFSGVRNIFKEPPLTSYRKGKSLKDTLVRAKL